MKKILFLLIALWVAYPIIATAQSGKVYDKLTVPSKILKSDRNYAIYLPPDYEHLTEVTRYFTCYTARLTIKPAGCNLVRFLTSRIKP